MLELPGKVKKCNPFAQSYRDSGLTGLVGSLGIVVGHTLPGVSDVQPGQRATGENRIHPSPVHTQQAHRHLLRPSRCCRIPGHIQKEPVLCLLCLTVNILREESAGCGMRRPVAPGGLS